MMPKMTREQFEQITLEELREMGCFDNLNEEDTEWDH